MEDPENRGRAKVHFPWLSDNESSGWAIVVSQNSAQETASFLQIGDEVYVAFEFGDIDRPILLGKIVTTQTQQ